MVTTPDAISFTSRTEVRTKTRSATDPLLTKQLEAMKQAALATARHAMDLRDAHKLDTEQKSDKSLVTTADKDGEAIIKTCLNQRFPHIRFLGEEGDDAGAMQTEGKRWVVDPVDGTNNFANNSGQWGVSIALQDGGVTQAAAVYVASAEDGRSGKLYTSIKGRGTFVEEIEKGFEKGEVRKLNRAIVSARQSPEAPLQLGGFCDDYPEKKYTGAIDGKMGLPKGEVYKAMQQAMRDAGGDKTYEPPAVTCATADSLALLEGKAGAYVHGIHFPWDSAGTFLLLSEAGVPVREYASNTDAGKSTLITAKNEGLMLLLDQAYRKACPAQEPTANTLALDAAQAQAATGLGFK